MSSPTSLNALESARRRAPRQKDRILHYFRSLPGGFTDEELCNMTGLSASTIRPRRGELVEAGLVVDSGQTRKTKSGHDATLWRLATAEEREAFEATKAERELHDLAQAADEAWARYAEIRKRYFEVRDARRAEVSR